MAPREITELKIEFLRNLHTFGSGDDRAIIALAIKNPDDDASETIKIKGNPGLEDFESRARYLIRGYWDKHPTYGLQFKFESKLKDKPVGRRAVMLYLARLPGIGPGIAERLWNAFAEKAVENLRLFPDAAARTVVGLKADVAKNASALLTKAMVDERVKMDLYQLLDGRGIQEKTKEKLCQDFGLEAAERVRANPYILMQYDGVGFLTADKIYLELGGDPANPERQAYCLHHAIDVSTGDVWVPSGRVYDLLRKNIASGKPDYDLAVREAKRRDMVETIKVGDMEYLATPARARQERHFAKMVKAMLKGPANWPDMSGDAKLSEHQKGVLDVSLRKRLTCLTGTPGTGKSLSLSRIINGLRREIDCGNVAVCAPFGKAAVRITELMGQQMLKIGATTVHSLLSAKRFKSGWEPGFNEFNPLPIKYLFMEEVSTADLWTMEVLFSALRSDIHVMLVGDVNQLAPVGCGAPFRDILNSGMIPNGELTELWRFSGKIAQVCKEMRLSGMFSPGDSIGPDGANMMHIHATTPAQQLSALEQMARRIIESKNYDPRWHFQVICAVNEKGDLSRAKLNEMLQSILNPSGRLVADGKFKLGDKVICNKNHWQTSGNREADGTNERGECYVANGEFGEVKHADDKHVYMELTAPYRLVKVPIKGTKKENKEDEGSIGISLWEIGYACTSHKYQGSQAPIVATMIDSSNSAKYTCDRNWLYTAISRAQAMSFTIGRKAVADEFCTWTSINDRKTLLVELLTDRIIV